MANFMNQSITLITGSSATSTIWYSCVVNHHTISPIVVDARIGKVCIAKRTTSGVGVNEQITCTKATILLESRFVSLFVIIEPSIILMISAFNQGELEAMGSKCLIQNIHTAGDLALRNPPSVIGLVKDHEMCCHIDCLQLATMAVCKEFGNDLVVLRNLFMSWGICATDSIASTRTEFTVLIKVRLVLVWCLFTRVLRVNMGR